ncbi:MAG TPA: hypothetical protein PKD09_05720 [Aggregatilinea sp.]|uniref:hypothetical protein n=1 Tax=Aggregatilinea sp. TaxID=2806333 RepID=UPI002BFA3D11|nr:hypothetical protein [Aggregatilinea sp.]HML21122.1 hypothetical protein [Aggregatilinea sp.]
MSKNQKSLVMLVIVIAVLGLSGYWLDRTGYLEVPRVFDVPAVLTGSDAGGSAMGERPAGDFGGQDRNAEFEGAGQGERPQGGGGHEGGGGLSERVLLSMASDVWFLAVTITAVVIVMRGAALVKAQLRRARHPAMAASS